jgi:ABC-type Na+ efflux pump permease subunit
MHFLPIAERELRVASRRPRTYRSRVVGAAVALVFGGYLFWVWSRLSGMGGAGRPMFAIVVQSAFLYCLFAGVGSTADCLSCEKREGTMGFLFLTQLRGYDIVSGKLLASSLLIVYGILATVPVFSICLIVGGVQWGEFGRVVLALLNTLYFSLAIGMLVSACCRHERRASQIASGIVALFGFALPGLGEYLRLKTSAVELGLFLKALSPSETIAWSTIPTSSVKYFWWSLLIVHVLAWAALGLACFILPRSWQERARASQPLFRLERWRRFWLGNSNRRLTLRFRLLKKNPFLWLAARATLVPAETWILLGSITVIATLAGWLYRAIIPIPVLCVMAVIALHSVLKMQICSAACERLAEDKHNGTLEVLLATPLTVREIVWGQWLALTRFFTIPIVTVVLLDGVMLLLIIGSDHSDVFPEPKAPAYFFVAGILTLLADAVALGWLGMWQALATRHTQQARSYALFYILVVPWIVFIFLISLEAFSTGPNSPTWRANLGLWFWMGIVNSLAFSLVARAKLYSRFRLMATQRFLSTKPVY